MLRAMKDRIIDIHPTYTRDEVKQEAIGNAPVTGKPNSEGMYLAVQFRTAQKVCDVAKNMGKWIYHPAAKQWYTPEEFAFKFATLETDDDLFYKIAIKHPTEGLEAGYKQLEILSGKLKNFSLKIVDYYRKK